MSQIPRGASATPTEQKTVEAAWRDLEQRLGGFEAIFHQLSGSLEQLIWMADHTGCIFWYNQQWYNYTGTTLAEMQGWGWQKVHHPDHLERVVAAVSVAWGQGRQFELVFPLRRKDGAYQWFLTRVVPVFDAEHRLVNWFGTNTNIDQQVNTQHKTEELSRQLSAAVAVRDDFLAVASHELKTPLTVLKIQMGMRRRRFLRNRRLPVHPREGLDALCRDEMQVDRIARLVNDMLDASRISAKRLPMRKKKEDLSALVRDVCAYLHEQMVAAKCPARLDIAPGLTMVCDRLRVEQVVTNLITNAIKYGAGTPVSISLRGEGARLRLDVQDAGPGIDPIHLRRVFEQFERAVDRNEVSGLGLGLFIAQSIVASHEGSIELLSELGRGACFRVRFPRADGIVTPPPRHLGDLKGKARPGL